jgi:hypothetical protein
MRSSLALAVAAASLVACSKDAKQAVANSIKGSKLEALSGNLEFLTSGGLSKLELVPTGTPSLKLAVDAEDPLLAPLNATLFERIDVTKDLDGMIGALVGPILEKLKGVDWGKETGGLGLRDEAGYDLLGGSEFSIELPSSPGSPSHLVMKSDAGTATLWLRVFWPLPDASVEKGLELGISTLEGGKPRISVLYDAARLAQLAGLPSEACVGNKVQLRLDVDEAPKMRVDMGECVGETLVTKSLWVQKAADGFRLAGRVTTDVSFIFQAVTDLQAVPQVVADLAVSDPAEITSLASYMADNGLGRFVDRYVAGTFWRPEEEASPTNLAPLVCELELLGEEESASLCAPEADGAVLRGLLTGHREEFPEDLRPGVDALLRVLAIGNPVVFGSELSFGEVPAALAPLEATLRVFQEELEKDANYMSGGFVAEVMPVKDLPKGLFESI